jgi:WD40 repeat protein
MRSVTRWKPIILVMIAAILLGSCIIGTKLFDLEPYGPLVRVIRKVAFTADSNYIVATDGRTVAIWDTTTGSSVDDPHAERILVNQDTGVSPDGNMRVEVEGDAVIALWDNRVGTRRRTFLPALPSIQELFSPDGRTLAIVSSTSTQGKIVLCDTTNDNAPLRTIAHSGPIWVLFFTADSTMLIAVGSTDITIYHSETGGQVRTITSNYPFARAAAFDSPRSRIAVQSEQGIEVWEVDGKRLVALASPHGVTCIAFSQDGNKLACGTQDCTVRLWQLESGQLLHTMPFPTHSKRWWR